MRFTTRVVLLQLAVVVAVVAVCVSVFAAISVIQVRSAAEETALNIARTVASSPEVRAEVARWSADPGTPRAADLVDGPLQQTAASVAERTDALFVVITDDHGIRLAHPRADRLGEVVSTPFADVLAGEEVVDWEVGTLGRSARAKVPVMPPDGGAPVGEVSVGFEEGSVFDDLPVLLAGIGVAAALALALGAVAGLILRRRWERLTLGLQPEELVALVQHQTAVVDGVGDGVLALDESGIVRVASATASRLLGLVDPLGRPLTALGLPGNVVRAVEARTPVTAVIGDRIVWVEVQPVRRGAQALGDVVIVRDRTDVTELHEQLSSVSTATGALRVQRHEFANRLHVAAGLLDADRVDDARSFLDDLLGRGPVAAHADGLDRVDDVFLQALLGAKAAEAAGAGVRLRIGEETLLLGSLVAVEDAAAILGNLIDNAVTAARQAPDQPEPGQPEPRRSELPGWQRWVEVTLLGDGAELVAIVGDSGPGIPDGVDPFAPRDQPADDRIHGRGIGLPLSRELARRRGGDLWLISAGGAGGDATGAVDDTDAGAPATGAVFGVRLPGALRPETGEELPR